MNKTRLTERLERVARGEHVRGYRVVCGSDVGNYLPTDFHYHTWLLIESNAYGYFVWEYVNHTTNNRWNNVWVYWIDEEDANEIATTRRYNGGRVTDELDENYDVFARSFCDGTPSGIHMLFND